MSHRVSLVPDSETSHRSPTNRWDWLWIIAVLLLFAIYSFVRARHRIFWGDELNAYVLMQQKSFWAMMHNWRLSLDSGSLFYASVGYWWVRLFSPPEIALRAFSAIGMMVSFVVLWIVARRFYPLAVVGACLPVAYLLNEYIRWQFYNGRMYGGFMAAAALVLYALVEAAPSRALTNRILLLTFFAHLFLMSSHVLGVLYSGVFIGGLIAQDLWARAFRPRLYLSALASWLVLFITYANIKNTAALSKFGYLTQTPRFSDLIKGIAVYSSTMLGALIFLGAAALVSHFVVQSRKEQTAPQTDRTPIYFVLLCYVCVLLLAFAVSRVKTSIFFNRYLLPIYLGDALLMCELLYRAVQPFPWSPTLRRCGVAAGILIFVAMYAREFPRAFAIPQYDYTEALVEAAPKGLPIIITDPGIFAEMEHYRGSRTVIVTPLDWSVSLGPGSDYATAPGALQLERWTSGGIFAGNILSTQDILTRFPKFVVMNTPEHSLWFQKYVEDNPRYDVKRIGAIEGQDIFLADAHRYASSRP